MKGQIVIYEGEDKNGKIIYQCSDCSAAPEVILGKNASIFVNFLTFNETIKKGKIFLSRA